MLLGFLASYLKKTHSNRDVSDGIDTDEADSDHNHDNDTAEHTDPHITLTMDPNNKDSQGTDGNHGNRGKMDKEEGRAHAREYYHGNNIHDRRQDMTDSVTHLGLKMGGDNGESLADMTMRVVQESDWRQCTTFESDMDTSVDVDSEDEADEDVRPCTGEYPPCSPTPDMTADTVVGTSHMCIVNMESHTAIVNMVVDEAPSGNGGECIYVGDLDVGEVVQVVGDLDSPVNISPTMGCDESALIESVVAAQGIVCESFHTSDMEGSRHVDDREELEIIDLGEDGQRQNGISTPVMYTQAAEITHPEGIDSPTVGIHVSQTTDKPIGGDFNNDSSEKGIVIDIDLNNSGAEQQLEEKYRQKTSIMFNIFHKVFSSPKYLAERQEEEGLTTDTLGQKRKITTDGQRIAKQSN